MPSVPPSDAPSVAPAVAPAAAPAVAPAAVPSVAPAPLSDLGAARLLRLGGDELEIGPIAEHEHSRLFVLFAGAVAKGEGYAHAPPLTRTGYEEAWVRPVSVVVVARLGGEVVGAYYLKPNGPGRAAHIANAGYLVAAAQRRRGIARLLVADSVERAPLCGFDAVQFNFVFASNPARPLYEELGWREIGRVPEAVEGEDAVIYWRRVGAGAPPLPATAWGQADRAGEESRGQEV